jgi:hypothetical protein
VNRRERIGRLLPAPLALVVVLLVALIVLTPILLSSGQPAAGTILTQADLIVDRVVGSNTTHFYVHGVGTTIRYAQMSLQWDANFSWTGSFPSGRLNWTNGTNGSDVLTIVFPSDKNPIAINVSAYYQVTSSTAYYVGEFAFDVAPGPSGAEYLYLVSGTPGLGVTTSWPVANLPLTIPLLNIGGSP